MSFRVARERKGVIHACGGIPRDIDAYKASRRAHLLRLARPEREWRAICSPHPALTRLSICCSVSLAPVGQEAICAARRSMSSAAEALELQELLELLPTITKVRYTARECALLVCVVRCFSRVRGSGKHLYHPIRPS